MSKDIDEAEAVVRGLQDLKYSQCPNCLRMPWWGFSASSFEDNALWTCNYCKSGFTLGNLRSVWPPLWQQMNVFVDELSDFEKEQWDYLETWLKPKRS